MRIAVSGGPGGGKTTAADLFRRELGQRVAVVPESATMLFRGGFPRSEDYLIRTATQRAIFHVQRNLEDIYQARFQDRVLLCDRGTVDGGAYWPKGGDDFFTVMGTELKVELSRYDAVVFFQSAAVGDSAIIENGNPTRVETLDKARELDGRLHALWSQHPEFHHVPHQKSFLRKVREGLDVLLKLVEDGINTP